MFPIDIMPANDPRNLSAEKITLDDIQRYFGLDDRPDPNAFLEWQQDLPDLTDDDRSRLDKAQAYYAHLSKRPILNSGFWSSNRNNFIFLKLKDNAYQLSDEFSLRRRGDLYQVLAILKQLANLLNPNSEPSKFSNLEG